MSQRSFDDFQGLLSDVRAEAMDRAPGLGDKIKLFKALSYQVPSDVPGGLAEITQLFGIDPDDLQTQWKGFIADVDERKAEGRQWTPEPGSKALARSPRGKGAFQNRSDSGNAVRFVSQFFDCLRFCSDTNRWLIWDGTHWAPDETGEVYQYAHATVQEIYKEAANLTEPAERKAHAAHALRTESEARLKAMLSLARYEAGMPVRRAQLDAHPFMINAANGVIDLENGDLLDFKQDLFFTKILPWAIEPDMETPHWDRFLAEITGGDPGLVAYLQQIAGYCLTASTREQCFFIFWGDGRNGKSTFIKILLEMLGSWAAQTPADTLMAKKGNNNHNDLARLFDKRMVAAI